MYGRDHTAISRSAITVKVSILLGLIHSVVIHSVRSQTNNISNAYYPLNLHNHICVTENINKRIRSIQMLSKLTSVTALIFPSSVCPTVLDSLMEFHKHPLDSKKQAFNSSWQGSCGLVNLLLTTYFQQAKLSFHFVVVLRCHFFFFVSCGSSMEATVHCVPLNAWKMLS